VRGRAQEAVVALADLLALGNHSDLARRLTAVLARALRREIPGLVREPSPTEVRATPGWIEPRGTAGVLH